ncbi:MAG TPA: hypothetical protein VE983_07175, partial [Solirubrobacteraceae bacterium]|nr:hypothetical protein [Solirubrobacteraceae bacterium]
GARAWTRPLAAACSGSSCPFGSGPDWLTGGATAGTDIAHTSGTEESLIHSAMMAEAGLAMLLGLFLEVNAGVLRLTYGTLLAHELDRRLGRGLRRWRRVAPTEQHVHGFLERVPLMGALAYAEELVRCLRATRTSPSLEESSAALPGTTDQVLTA